jgi:hypothetical protein
MNLCIYYDFIHNSFIILVYDKHKGMITGEEKIKFNIYNMIFIEIR